MVAEGMSASEIQAALEKRVGGNLSGSPHPEASYAVPILLSLAAAFLLYLIFSRLRPARVEAAPHAPEPTARTVNDDRLERELAAEGAEDDPDELA